MSALSAVLRISVSNSGLFFFMVGTPGRTAEYWFTQYPTSDVAENLDSYLSCTQYIAEGNDFELILTVTIEGCIMWNDIIQYSPEAIRYLCTSGLLSAFDDA